MTLTPLILIDSIAANENNLEQRTHQPSRLSLSFPSYLVKTLTGRED
jgi:hypothetical protein